MKEQSRFPANDLISALATDCVLNSSPMIRPGDATTVTSAHAVLEGKSRQGFVARLLPFLGPAFVACVAYIDPGNFATNIQAGAEFGYLLL